MAKGETKKTNQMQDAQINRQNAAQDWQNSTAVNRSGVMQGRSDVLYDDLYGGFKNFATGASGAAAPAGTGSSAGGGAGPNQKLIDTEASYRDFMAKGGIDADAARKGNATLEELQKNGGWDDATRARMGGFISNYEDLAKNGGYDANMLNRARGGGVFDEFAQSGGYSGKDIGNIRARSNAGVSAAYGAARDEASRAAAASGGYGPGRLAAMTRMARDQSRAAGDTALNTELGIKDKVNAGRQWGAGSMATAEDAIARNMSATKLAANQGGSSALAGMTNSIAGNRAGAADTLNSGERAIQKMIQEGKMYGTSGLNAQGESDRATAMSAANASAANDRWLAEFNREGQQYGLGGLMDLYSNAPGMEMGYYNTMAPNNAGYGGTVNQSLGNRYDANRGTNWMGAVGSIAGGAAGLMTGAGALGIGKKR